MEEENKDEIKDSDLIETSETESEGIQISNDVISTIAGKAVSDVNGVAGMAGRICSVEFQKYLAERKT